MGEVDTLFPLVVGVYTFQNEFICSGHTAIAFLFPSSSRHASRRR